MVEIVITMTPLTHPTTDPRDYRDEVNQRGEGGLIKVKNKLTLAFILGDLKHFEFRPCLFPIKGAGWVGSDLNGKFHNFFLFF